MGAYAPKQPDSDKASSAGARRAFIAALLGWMMDAFDFFVLVFVLPNIAQEFHRPVKDIAYTITVTLATRPLGAVIFGWAADRFGRRIPLMVDVVFYSIVEVLSGLAPNYATFLCLRALYGVGMGGEWGAGASLAMEAVPARRRGLLSGLLQEGYAFGYLLAAAAFFIVFPRFGWRAMFFVGGAPALLAFYIRIHMPESKVWQRSRPDARRIWLAIKSNAGSFAYLVILMTTMNLMAHGTQDIYPTFMRSERGLTARAVATIAIIYNFGAIAGGLAFGHLSDRLGRRRAMIVAELLALIFIPLWIYSRATWALTLGAFMMQFMVQGAWGVIPAHLTELSPSAVRGLFPGLAYQLGVLLASAAPYVEASLANTFGYANALALVTSIVLAAALITVAIGHERAGADFESETAA